MTTQNAKTNKMEGGGFIMGTHLQRTICERDDMDIKFMFISESCIYHMYYIPCVIYLFIYPG
jgi:hypothetical protein